MQIEQIDQLRATGLGNTGSPVTVKKGSIQGRQETKWAFTWNNPDHLELIEQLLELYCKKGVASEERGESGTRHLQGSIWLKKRKRLTELKKIFSDVPRFSVIKYWDKSCIYCQKSDTRVIGGWSWTKGYDIPFPIKVLKSESLYSWELNIIDIIKTPPSERDIYWYWESIGNIGKSTFAKYLAVEFDALILSGKAADMKYAIATMIKNKKSYPRLIVLDVPRTSEGYLSYKGIEEVKNACFFSSKYESGMVIGNCPHIFIFANFYPDDSLMSQDRWKIVNIGNDDNSSC